MNQDSELVYKNGYPFDEKLVENIRDLYVRVKQENKAACVVIDGGIGEGKTTLGIEVGDLINQLDGKAKIVLLKKESFQIGMGGAAFVRNLKAVFKNDYPVVIYDEGGDFNRRGSLTQFNQLINRIFETYRAFKVLVIICLPSFKIIDQDLLLKGIPRLLIHCEDRGQSYGNFKAYSLYRMFYILDLMKKLKVPNFAYQITDPNFQGHFLNLEKSREKELDKLCTDAKLLEAEKAEIKLEGLISVSELARKVAKTTAWVGVALKQLNIKPVRKISKSWYYKEDVALESLWNFNLRPEARGRKGG
jgi:hypothetical protein